MRVEPYPVVTFAFKSASDVAASLLPSAEYQARHAGLSDGQYVNALYQGLLGRSETAPGYWTTLLAQGASRSAVAVGIADSPEAKASLAAATARVFAPDAAGTLIQELSKTGLDRDADLNTLLYNQVAGPFTPLQTAQQIAGAALFRAMHDSQDGATYVNSLYYAGLGRAADAAGASYWGGLLAGGAGRAEVLLGIATSPEAAAHLTAPGL